MKLVRALCLILLSVSLTTELHSAESKKVLYLNCQNKDEFLRIHANQNEILVLDLEKKLFSTNEHKNLKLISYETEYYASKRLQGALVEWTLNRVNLSLYMKNNYIKDGRVTSDYGYQEYQCEVVDRI